MNAPVFLTLADAIDLHNAIVDDYGGCAGLRDVGLLEAALAMPSAGFGGEYFHADLPEMAAAYLFHMCKNHPFVDGNKRTASTVACVFLHLNGLTLTASGRDFEKLILGVAEGRLMKSDAAVFLRKHSKRTRR